MIPINFWFPNVGASVLLLFLNMQLYKYGSFNGEKDLLCQIFCQHTSIRAQHGHNFLDSNNIRILDINRTLYLSY